MGCNDDYRLPVHMVLFLGERGFLNLGQIADHELSSIWRQVWLSADRIGFSGEDAITWDSFTASLGSSHVSINDKEDSIIGQKIPLGSVLQRLVIKLFALGKSWRNQHGGGNLCENSNALQKLIILYVWCLII